MSRTEHARDDRHYCPHCFEQTTYSELLNRSEFVRQTKPATNRQLRPATRRQEKLNGKTVYCYHVARFNRGEKFLETEILGFAAGLVLDSLDFGEFDQAGCLDEDGVAQWRFDD